MSYYKQIKEANEWIDLQIEEIKKDISKEIIINKLLFEAGVTFEVGEKIFLKRIEQHIQLNNDLILENGILTMRI